MKLRDVASDIHSTSSDLNFTQPFGVLKTRLLSGVGIVGTFRFGGVNTDTSKSPTTTPVNIQNILIILVLVNNPEFFS